MSTRMQKGQAMTDELREAEKQYVAMRCDNLPTDCVDFGVVDRLTGKEVCRVWTESDCRMIADLLNAPPIPDAIMPEIDRRVAEERAKLLERLREPSEGMLSAGGDVPCDDYISGGVIYSTTAETRGVWKAMLAQFEKENSHEQG